MIRVDSNVVYEETLVLCNEDEDPDHLRPIGKNENTVLLNHL
jgi:hypothetical protein